MESICTLDALSSTKGTYTLARGTAPVTI